ncbi:TPA: hypothetical protein F3L18_20120 [Aeromonas hydrophila]|nr:hypothetical protein [Aeromonas hydrophila]HAU4860262.1 hypothetical protein [Aeromonas hydrophila]HAU4864812.1 hypothetical protein [Aeromonas hydrophila]HAU4869288.1 hypothetical protein [Aeromonas hydrophila]HAU4882174.1 hypothetical protein [Aeromonas hydrophila]
MTQGPVMPARTRPKQQPHHKVGLFKKR